MNFMPLIIDGLSWVLLMLGSIFMLIGAYGAIRLPDFWTRLHAVSVTDTGGVLLLTAGMVMQAGFSLVTFKLILIAVFIFITGPTAMGTVQARAVPRMTATRPLGRPSGNRTLAK